MADKNSKLNDRIINIPPKLSEVNGIVVINEKDPEQVKWFEEFKK